MQRRITILLDGIWGRPKRFGPLRELLHRDCGPTEVFTYDSSGRVPFEELASRLCERIRAIGAAVNLIGFSMGGIVVRTAHLLDPALPIARAAFLNTPHHGSLIAYGLPFAGVRQLRPGSALMRKLADADWRIPALVTWCPLDGMVLPGWSAKWDRATETIRCDVPMHIWPIWSKRIHRRVVDFFLRGSSEDLTGPLAMAA